MALGFEGKVLRRGQGTSRAEPLCAEPLCAEPLYAEPLCAEPFGQALPGGVRGAKARLVPSRCVLGT